MEWNIILNQIKNKWISQCYILISLLVFHYFFLSVFSFNFLIFFYVNKEFPLPPLFPLPLSSPNSPFALKYSPLRWSKTSHGNQQRIVRQTESGPSSSPLHQDWTMHSTIRNRFQEASSCIKNRSWSHC